MKLWFGHGSEHSANLVMIGHFKDAATADEAKNVIEQLTKQVNDDVQADRLKVGSRTDRFTDGMLELVRRLEAFTISPGEMEQFAYDVSVSTEGSRVVIRTDETDISGFLKILFDKGAKIEVYSAHVHKDEVKAA